MLGFHDLVCAKESETEHYKVLKKVHRAACEEKLFKPMMKKVV